jgi:penicillin-binding protein 1C
MAPEYDPVCGIPSNNLSQIRIISPERYLEYFVEPHRELEIELLASVPGDSKTIYWFANENLIGSTVPAKAMYWKAKPGKFNLKVVDDRGRSRSVEVSVSSVSDNS